MRLLVIGGVAAGLSAAARARRIDPSLEILVLEKGDDISYGACGLPYYVEGRVRRPDELIVYTPEYFRNERNITVRTGAAVASIAHARREVALRRRRAHSLRPAGDRDRGPAGRRRHRGRGSAARLPAAHAGGRHPAETIPDGEVARSGR